MAMTREQAQTVVEAFERSGTQAELRDDSDGYLVDVYLTIEATTFDSYERALAFAEQNASTPAEGH